jgi:hypothetical protein
MVMTETSKASITKNRTTKRRVLGFCIRHLSRFAINNELPAATIKLRLDRGVAPSNDNSVIVGSEVEKGPPTNEGLSLRRLP